MKMLHGHFRNVGRIAREDGITHALAYDALRTIDRYPIIKKPLGDAYRSLVDFEDRRKVAESERNDRKELAYYLRHMRNDARYGWSPDGVVIARGMLATKLKMEDRFDMYIDRIREKAERIAKEVREQYDSGSV